MATIPAEDPAADVVWKPGPPVAKDGTGRIDLAGIVQGNECVVYLRARVFSPREMPVRLEIGSDDGNKVWVNGKLVHANNVARGFTAGQDKAPADLRKGLNDLLLKITQNSMGCDASVRIVGRDELPIDGLLTAHKPDKPE